VGLHDPASERLEDHFGPTLLPSLALHLAIPGWDEDRAHQGAPGRQQEGGF